MTSTIDRTQPVTNAALASSVVRNSFNAAANDIEAIQGQISSISTTYAPLVSPDFATGTVTFPNAVTWSTSGISRLITASPQSLFGTTAATGIGGLAQGSEQVGINGTSNAAYGRWSPDTSGNQLVYYKSRGTTVGSHAAVVPGDFMATISAVADDGINQNTKVARVSLLADPLGTISTGIIPGSITFSTANSSGALANALTIDSNQTTTFIDGSKILATGYSNTGTYTGSAVNPFTIANIVTSSQTTNFTSSSIGTTFNPTGASAGSISALGINSILGVGSVPLASIRGTTVNVNSGTAYTGAITTSAGIVVNQLAGSVTIPTWNSLQLQGVANNGNGITGGTVNNNKILINASGSPATPAAGGTLNHTCIAINIEGASGAGTTTNTGIFINGNGGSGGSGTTNNWAIFSQSTANSALYGKLGLGMTPANTVDVGFSVAGISAISNNNSNSGTTAQTAFLAINGTYTTAMGQLGTGFTNVGIYRQNGGYLYASGPGGLTLTTAAVAPIYFGIGNSQTEMIDTSGRHLIGYTTSNGSYPLQVNGQIFATSATIATSDANFKTNVASIGSALSLIQALIPREFDFIENPIHNFPSGRQVGFLAQEVQTAFAGTDYLNALVYTNSRDAVDAVPASEAVLDANGDIFFAAQPEQAATPSETFLGLAYSAFIPLLVKSIQELSEQVVVLQGQVTTLQGA